MANQIVLNNISAEARILSLVAPANTVNGSILAVGTRASNGTYAASAPSAITLDDLAMVLDMPLSYEAQYVENDYTIATGDIVRAYVPYKGMTVTIPQANITATATLTVDYVVTVDAGEIKPECKTTAGGTETVVFEIVELPTVNGVASAKLRCIKA